MAILAILAIFAKALIKIVATLSFYLIMNSIEYNIPIFRQFLFQNLPLQETRDLTSTIIFGPQKWEQRLHSGILCQIALLLRMQFCAKKGMPIPRRSAALKRRSGLYSHRLLLFTIIGSC